MNPTKVRVAVLRGGPSNGYNNSLKTGEYVLRTLREMSGYEPLDILISKDGEWHKGGLVGEPHKILRQTDVVWNALHGSYGEDGQVQSLLDKLQVPYTGSNTMASIFAMNKDMTKRIYRDHTLLTPAHELVTRDSINEDKLVHIFRNYLHPVIVKPANASGSIGIRKAHSFYELRDAIQRTFEYSPKVLVEEFVRGSDVSCVVIERAKGERLYALLPVSSSNTQLRVDESQEIQRMAKKAHEALGLRHYSSSDFIVTPRNKIYMLETNSLPVLDENSLTHRALVSTGWRQSDFVNHIISLTLN